MFIEKLCGIYNKWSLVAVAVQNKWEMCITLLNIPMHANEFSL